MAVPRVVRAACRANAWARHRAGRRGDLSGMRSRVDPLARLHGRAAYPAGLARRPHRCERQISDRPRSLPRLVVAQRRQSEAVTPGLDGTAAASGEPTERRPAGRPSAMHIIEVEMRRRASADPCELLDTLSGECEVLAKW